MAESLWVKTCAAPNDCSLNLWKDPNYSRVIQSLKMEFVKSGSIIDERRYVKMHRWCGSQMTTTFISQLHKLQMWLVHI